MSGLARNPVVTPCRHLNRDIEIWIRTHKPG